MAEIRVAVKEKELKELTEFSCFIVNECKWVGSLYPVIGRRGDVDSYSLQQGDGGRISASGYQEVTIF